MPRDAVHSADYAVASCLGLGLGSVRLWHASFLSKRLHISWNFFHDRAAILVFLHETVWQYSDGTSVTGASNARGYEKSRFSTNISLYLGNDTRPTHSYYGRRIGSGTQAFEWHRFEWPWVTSNPDLKVTPFFDAYISQTSKDTAVVAIKCE